MSETFPHIEMPRQFRSDESGELLQRCAVCGSNVLDREDPYAIDKTYRHGQLIYELVMCWTCLDWFEQGHSRQSLQAIDEYMEANNYRERQYEALLAISSGRVEPWIVNCGFTGRPMAGERTYQLKGVGMQGDLMLLPRFPMASSSEAGSAIWRLMSPDTSDFWCQFGNDYLGVPPAMMRDDTIEPGSAN